MEPRVESDKDDKRQTEFLSPQELVELVRKVGESCNDWLCGTRTSESLQQEFNRVRDVDWRIHGFDGKPEDFDWSDLTDAEWAEADKLSELLRNAMRLVAAANGAAEEIKKLPIQQDSAVLRAHFLGKRTSQYRFDPLEMP
ncbi:hypothetical protein M4951_16590 [Blastopirellula sp. J2-11]|uniref:hypothetical protein n=1 Tax=Blastopirellula sp. J2-11 TaxID=2943192 RepID=UPI0021C64663|nr:hypothetical protein [Blastopirellula sp. J2-11]UUO04998.1 hypothetical protein M4951_16590 [Blastopirellula sp. J2-11]